jgi:hypothetical protein
MEFFGTTIFVTCFINIYETPQKPDEWRIEHFKTLLSSGITIVLFISPQYSPIFQEMQIRYDNLTFYEIDIFTQLPLFFMKNTATTATTTSTTTEISLPYHRNHSKDTYNYMALMNSKTDLIMLAMKHATTPATHYAWIDFNISYIFKQAQITHSFLQFFAHFARFATDKPFLCIPGCWDTPAEMTPLIIDHVNWHFCGGFFIGDRQSIIEFHTAITNHIYEQTIFHQPPLMVWETNFWTFLQTNGHWKPTHWFKVDDHDETMLTLIPPELYTHPLTWDTVVPFVLQSLPIPPDFHISSISYTKTVCTDTTDITNEILVCRAINYRLSDDGRQYIYPYANENQIKNINVLVNLTTGDPVTILQTHPFNEFENCFSSGLEDIRIYEDKSFTASSVSFGNGIVPQIVTGFIDTQKGCVVGMRHIRSPTGNDNQCEKNWIFVKNNNGKRYIIYRWFPFELAILCDDGKVAELKIVLSFNLSPQYIFRNMRGSTPFCNYTRNGNNWLIGTTHYGIDQPPTTDIVRKYYHVLVILNPQTLIPYAITPPFTFSKKHAIEFCIGMRFDLDTRIFTFWVSIMDESPTVFSIHDDAINFIALNNYPQN